MFIITVTYFFFESKTRNIIYEWPRFAQEVISKRPG